MSVERRRELGIPVCLSPNDHTDRGDGYCNCGELMASRPGLWLDARIKAGSAAPKGSLDKTERNPE